MGNEIKQCCWFDVPANRIETLFFSPAGCLQLAGIELQSNIWQTMAHRHKCSLLPNYSRVHTYAKWDGSENQKKNKTKACAIRWLSAQHGSPQHEDNHSNADSLYLNIINKCDFIGVANLLCVACQSKFLFNNGMNICIYIYMYVT